MYVLSSDKVTVMSETGGIVRRLRFRKSDPETTAVRLNVSDGLLSIVLAKTGKDQVQIRKYLVMYAVTGEKFGYYEPSEELGNTDVCFSRTDGYTFDPSSPDPESLLKIKAMSRPSEHRFFAKHHFLVS